MGCCGKDDKENEEDELLAEPQAKLKELCKREPAKCKDKDGPYTWYPTESNIQQIAYVRRLENQYQSLQSCYLDLSSQMARLQFRIRQIIQADPIDRAKLISDLERIVFKENEAMSQCRPEELPSLERHNQEMGDIKKKQHLLIKTLRQQIGSFQEATNNLTTEYQYEDNDWTKEQDKINSMLEENKSKIDEIKSEATIKASDTKLRKPGGSDYFMKAATRSTETCSSYGEHEASVRSTSFKELREMYQRGCTKNT